MRIFKQRNFHQWTIDEKISDAELSKVIQEMNTGLFEANLGSGLYKKRVSMPGKGKRGAYRTIIAFKQNERAFFIYGFSKNEKANIDEQEKLIYCKIAKEYLNMSTAAIQYLLDTKKLLEI